MTISEFLLARIAEDEADAKSHFCEPGFEVRIFAECAAKRAIVEWCDKGIVAMGAHHAKDEMYLAKTLAAVDRDHPDYRQEWAID